MKLIFTILLGLSVFAVGCSHGHHHKKGHHMSHLKDMDANKDGVISKAEFDQASAEKFKKMDADNDGLIKLEEKECSVCKSSEKKGHCAECDKKPKDCKTCEGKG